MVDDADLILAMEQYHLKMIRSLRLFGTAGKTFLLSTFDSTQDVYEVPDPIGGDSEMYAESARLIHACIKGVYTYIGEKNEA